MKLPTEADESVFRFSQSENSDLFLQQFVLLVDCD